MYVEADPSGADSWKLEAVVDLLKDGAVGVIPTDTVYICPPTSFFFFFFNLIDFSLFWILSSTIGLNTSTPFYLL